MLKLVVKMVLFLITAICLWVLSGNFRSIPKGGVSNENIEITKIESLEDTIVCVLKSNKNQYKVGEVPDLSIEIINKTDSTIQLLGSLDGSDLGLRLPISQLNIQRPILGYAEASTFFCTTLNGLRERDFQAVSSHARFNPYNEGYFQSGKLVEDNFWLPGLYKISYYYSTLDDDGLLKEYKVGTNDRIDSLWNQMPKIELKSNTITIEYNF